MSLSDFAESSELIPEFFRPNSLTDNAVKCYDLQAPQNTPESSELIPELFNPNLHCR